jgi:putative mRNA 3-end processing factor
MLTLRKQGLYCEAGDFYVDPQGKVENAVVTHAHSDHARRGAARYFTARSGVGLVRARLGQGISITGFAFGERFRLGPVTVSFHPAGHILGSAQVRLEHRGEVWVASGDYKRDPDPTCEPFEPVPCDVFVTEATFGTPAYEWDKTADVGREIFDWWEESRRAGRNSLLHAYSLGKTQRVLGLLRRFTSQPAHLDPAAGALTECYRREGVPLLPTVCLSTLGAGARLEGALVVAPTSFLSSPLARLLGDDFETAFASGWMAQGGGWGRGGGAAEVRERYRGGGGYDRGFTLSDHADWNDLVRTVRETGASRVYVQHRGKGALVRHLRGLGIEAFPENELAKKPAAQLSLF